MLPGNIVIALEQTPQLRKRIVGGLIDHTPHASSPIHTYAHLVMLNYTHAISFCQVFRRVNNLDSRKMWYEERSR